MGRNRTDFHFLCDSMVCLSIVQVYYIVNWEMNFANLELVNFCDGLAAFLRQFEWLCRMFPSREAIMRTV